MLAVVLFQFSVLTIVTFLLCSGRKRGAENDGESAQPKPSGIGAGSGPAGGPSAPGAQGASGSGGSSTPSPGPTMVGVSGNPGAQPTGLTPTAKSSNDDFAVGVPLPHTPLADHAADDRSIADIESIQSEKVLLREKMKKAAAATPTGASGAAPGAPGASASAESAAKPRGDGVKLAAVSPVNPVVQANSKPALSPAVSNSQKGKA